jgi:hypothetical protein
MAQQPPPIHFEDISLDEARRMGWGPRMDPALYQAFKEKIQSLDNTAVRITVPEGTSPTTMKNRLLRVAAALNTPITVRRIPGGLLFWRSTAEDRQQATEVSQRLQSTRSKKGIAPIRPYMYVKTKNKTKGDVNIVSHSEISKSQSVSHKKWFTAYMEGYNAYNKEHKSWSILG